MTATRTTRPNLGRTPDSRSNHHNDFRLARASHLPPRMQLRDVIPAPIISFITWVGSTTLVTALFWMMFGSCVLSGCIDTPLPDREPQARLITSWDPLACGVPHRVAIEIEDDDGRMLSASVPCELGGMTLDVPAWGIYRGRIYAWSLAGSEATISSVVPVRLEIDMPIVEWNVETPR